MKLLIVLVFACFVYSSMAQSYKVYDQNTLNSVITSIKAGDTIIIANASSPYVDLEIKIKANGTADKPIVIKAETTGGVLLSGNSQAHMGGSYINFEGFSFGGNLPPDNLIDNSIIEFRSGTSASDNCNHCKMINVGFDAHNQSASLEAKVLKWVRVYGQDNEIANCTFINKKGVGNCITIERSDPIENRALIHNNYFANRVPVLDANNKVLNDQDAIRVGYSGTSLTDASCQVYNNFFYNWNGEAEIISNKSNKNKYYNNTFRKCVGTLTLRHGTHCEVYGNFFFGENISQSGGVRVIDSDHKIYNNYFQDLNTGSSKVVGAINLFKGDADFVISGQLNSYAICEDNLIANNTIVNCNKGIWIGPDDSGREYEPRNLEISNNIMIDCTDAVLTGATAPSGTNIIKGNIKKGGNWWSGFNTSENLATTTDLTSFDGIFARIKQNSQAIGYAYPLANFSNAKDILGGNRDNDPDAGAEEYGSTGINLPYNLTDVGQKIGVIISQSTGYNAPNSYKTKFKIFPNPASNNLSIVGIYGLLCQANFINSDGKLVNSLTLINEAKNVIDISALKPGMYLLELIDSSKSKQTTLFQKN